MSEFLTEHFKVSEMACPCCGLCEMHPRFMKELERFRQMVDVKLRINSGMRCKAHNAILPNASPNSMHLQGLAADIQWNGSKFMMLRIALATFDGIGISKEFLHVDLNGKPKLWIY